MHGLFSPFSGTSHSLQQSPAFTSFQSTCTDCWRVHARGQPGRTLQAQSHRSLSPHSHHLLCHHMECPPLHPLLYHPNRPRSPHASQIGVACCHLHRHPSFSGSVKPCITAGRTSAAPSAPFRNKLPFANLSVCSPSSLITCLC